MADWWTTRLSRRALARITAGAAGLSAALAFRPTSAPTHALGGQEQPGGSGVEQIRLKRAGVGLRAYDPEQAFPGFTLFKTLGPSRTLYVIDMAGNVVHTWTLPYGGLYGYLTDRGTLFYNGTIPNPDFPGRGSQLGVALEADWDGNILWEVRNPDHHNDGIRLRNGNVLLICYGILPSEIAAQVRGGQPGTEPRWGMDGDYLQEVTVDGRVVWEWRAWEHMDPQEYAIPWPMDSRLDWTHANGFAEWPNGDITVSFRNVSSVITVSRRTGEIVWELGSPPVSGQHAPTPLANGNLLIFDNGPHRFDHTHPHSRVLEIDVASKDIVWKYQEARVSDFYSPRISNAQRLPNGNTLINEGWFGRFFEVTADAEVVWEYVNPYFNFVAAQGADVNFVFRAYRYSAEEIDRARATGR